MAALLPRQSRFICRSCQRVLASSSNRRQFVSRTTIAAKQEVSPKSRRHVSLLTRIRNAPVTDAASSHDTSPSQSQQIQQSQTARAPSEVSLKTFNPAAGLKKLKDDITRLTSQDVAASREEVMAILLGSYEYANCIVFGTSKGPKEGVEKSGEDLSQAVLRDLAEDTSKESSDDAPAFVPDREMSAPFRQNAAGTIAELTYTLLRDPKVYISEDMLQVYVRIQCMLGKPEYIPEIFHLFAHKKIPNPKTKPVRYSDPWPKLPKYAVPLELAEAALESAILKKNLPLALAIIDTTVATKAFHANKILRRASFPIMFVGGTPIIAYAGANWVSHWQNTMDVEMAKYTAIAGALAYIGTLTTIGFVAVTTANDQMVRVVWRPGTGLAERWVREEERAFFDKLALAWGFQEKKRWGEEEGEDWQRLRDECGMRDMILDKTDLMEGMQ
ncbi:hypothetical protein HRR83_008924 [Exophiala dermatitidis]|uniref:Uncharacterized protein n=2 Tax=Exophiala dermatitidis TaxID=5970 RepID=H6BTR7_EXODN|nr:uncharacterized protein HMPREF1120_03628 [Exophiala dermatitidis NIH/UT8656]KAJ4503071.1 hypothetical protein HRR75_008176 [Exophiala dermatitidis]EHY55494.1 hypothetical protein HMPREF1120_03628 [Exophiala dermatitidis NIH/UT8656]KAJ4504254.1 hypothetical protein HRR73_008810 [Exophiala dermatitidis]KAJ4504635.1 hypothetical protein HRR74_008901 [Exophiala dermatitidis]KAJ4533512.1 hypothetical protein HRR77_008490 [Exophiala dermatitidis]